MADCEVLAGSGTVTCHHQVFNFACRLDVVMVFFNLPLGRERMRVRSTAGPGERMIVLFCGVSPFAIPIAAFFLSAAS